MRGEAHSQPQLGVSGLEVKGQVAAGRRKSLPPQLVEGFRSWASHCCLGSPHTCPSAGTSPRAGPGAHLSQVQQSALTGHHPPSPA